MGKLRFAALGTGFWARFRIPAWFEVGGVDLVALYTGQPAETAGEDNLKTMRLVYRAYESAAANAVISLDAYDCP